MSCVDFFKKFNNLFPQSILFHKVVCGISFGLLNSQNLVRMATLWNFTCGNFARSRSAPHRAGVGLPLPMPYFVDFFHTIFFVEFSKLPIKSSQTVFPQTTLWKIKNVSNIGLIFAAPPGPAKIKSGENLIGKKKVRVTN